VKSLLAAPYLEKRNSIVRGDLVPEGGEGEVKGIPGFWVKVLASHDAFAEIISDKDKQVLAHLQDVHVVRETITGSDSKPRWTVKLVFSFSPNEFFEEKELTKTYVYLDQEESIAERATGCDIKWKAGANFWCLESAHPSDMSLTSREKHKPSKSSSLSEKVMFLNP
jgi:hypothetical protein